MMPGQQLIEWVRCRKSNMQYITLHIDLYETGNSSVIVLTDEGLSSTLLKATLSDNGTNIFICGEIIYV